MSPRNGGRVLPAEYARGVPARSGLGRANWWLPGWLDRLLPVASLSEDEPRAEVPAAVPPGS